MGTTIKIKDGDIVVDDDDDVDNDGVDYDAESSG